MAQLILDDSDDTCDLKANMAYKMSQEFPTVFLNITLVPLFSHLQHLPCNENVSTSVTRVQIGQSWVGFSYSDD